MDSHLKRLKSIFVFPIHQDAKIAVWEKQPYNRTTAAVAEVMKEVSA
jgi:hypothetical protein